MRKHTILFCSLALLASLALIGCSDNSNPASHNTTSHAVDLLDVTAIIEASAPPEFTAPVSSPAADSFEVWVSGDSPLLDNVFGSVEPQTLYSNVDDFKTSMGIITHTMRTDDDGNLILGTYIDSADVNMGGTLVKIHFTAVVSALPDVTSLPLECRNIMGDSADLDYLISVDNEEMNGETILIGMKLGDTIQTLMQYDVGTGNPTDQETRLRYASVDPRDSTFVFKGMGYVLHADSDLFTYAFNINSDANSDFAYRMSWHSSHDPESDHLHCIIGGGNKDTEFALKYRHFTPADTNVCDSAQLYDQVFGPDYTEGVGSLSTFDNYLDDSLLVPYTDIPHDMITNPYGD